MVFNNNEDAFEGMILEESSVIHLSSQQQGIDPLLSSSQFYKFSYCSHFNQMLLISTQGIWSYNLDSQENLGLEAVAGSLFDYVSRFLPFRHMIENFKWVNGRELLMITTRGEVYTLTLQDKTRLSIQSLRVQAPHSVNLNISITQLSQNLLFLASDSQNHQLLTLDSPAQQRITQEIQNLGSLSQITEYLPYQSILLQKGS